MSRWALVSGPDTEAIAKALSRVAERLREGGVSVGGFVQARVPEEGGRRHYDVVRVGAGERARLGQERVRPKADEGCSVEFLDAGFEAARRWVSEDAGRVQVLIVDGLNKLEAGGEGHARTLAEALASKATVVLLGARDRQLSALMERFPLAEETLVAALEPPLESEAVDRFAADVARAVSPRVAAR
jgi:nucleoside-triphosphatase THEP1